MVSPLPTAVEDHHLQGGQGGPGIPVGKGGDGLQHGRFHGHLLVPQSPGGSVRARWSRVTRSSWVRAWRTNTLHRESSAPLISKEGFSVVAPMSRMLPFSTKGRKASCWALLKRWISSTKTMVRSPELPVALGLLHHRADLLDPAGDGGKVDEFRLCGVGDDPGQGGLSHPGGPQKIMEEIWSRSISWRRTFPGPSKCCCPTYSANVRGRSRAARGWVSSRANRLCCCMAASFPGIVPYCLWCYPITEGGLGSNQGPLCRSRKRE